ncbi:MULTISPECIES: GNAT family N-acetyltransferase [Streptomyces]|uniref:Ribosomal protein S18 acetylase RimI-like enzyme n=1 Tax=Streptomyces clavifer TaxID=68188 RepID=A0ABS4VH24_9ACTN|nr:MULTISPECIES: GNAT family N-acetyltransferase [Streptomyces]MBP2363116.1 ribosomal protein S18 acetylase RimI-like enzyme [Streptomyces clavifer]MDX2743082.1 GNAT family N-acetyltransferase [Streptomyces sp. NRRL_B-2557]RPK72454.1 ribosomal-protein-alanine N-acetyltransferase [Streptomyces sp. ADI97-07]WRY80423.1 GNAT family N-acetyltransferase [Streptomyces clavifer]GHB21763.1 acetyltransferase [Streptomyces clavifer]
MTQAAHVRSYRPDDREALADICVRTADNGGDSRHLYADPGLMPALFAEPYAHLEPELTLVLDDGAGQAVGYVLGTADTRHFVDMFRKAWLPLVTERFPEPAGPPRTLTEDMTALLYNPERMILPQLDGHPAHLHIDLLPPWQRKGYGRELMRAFLDALHARGVPAVHLSMLTANTPARAFYDRLGFHEIAVPDPGPLTYLGRSTEGCGGYGLGR